MCVELLVESEMQLIIWPVNANKQKIFVKKSTHNTHRNTLNQFTTKTVEEKTNSHNIQSTLTTARRQQQKQHQHTFNYSNPEYVCI